MVIFKHFVFIVVFFAIGFSSVYGVDRCQFLLRRTESVGAKPHDLKQRISDENSLFTYLTNQYDITPRVALWVTQKIMGYKAMRTLHDGAALPQEIKFHDKSYNVLGHLGSGAEGNVFLVESIEGLNVIKWFIDSEKATKNIQTLLRAHSLKVPTPKVLGIDGPLVLLEYVEGIPVIEFFQITESKSQNLIIDKFKKTMKSWKTSGVDYSGAINILYSFKTKSFIMIDPH
jgi:hypothetical protein